MSHVRRLAAATVAAAVCLVGLGSCTGDDNPAPTSTPSETSTPLADFATDALVVRRESVCADAGPDAVDPGAVDPDAVEEALGGEPEASSSYDNGEPARLTEGVTDVAHEFGCVWRRADGSSARAWVFAPPVTVDRARTLVRGARTAPGCSSAPDAPAFGRPSVAVVCRGDGTLEVSHRGLFGDAWLSCALAVPARGADRADRADRAALLDRAGHWCVAVATAASTQE
jgi:hypothetical protein